MSRQSNFSSGYRKMALLLPQNILGQYAVKTEGESRKRKEVEKRKKNEKTKKKLDILPSFSRTPPFYISNLGKYFVSKQVPNCRVARTGIGINSITEPEPETFLTFEHIRLFSSFLSRFFLPEKSHQLFSESHHPCLLIATFL